MRGVDAGHDEHPPPDYDAEEKASEPVEKLTTQKGEQLNAGQ